MKRLLAFALCVGLIPMFLSAETQFKKLPGHNYYTITQDPTNKTPSTTHGDRDGWFSVDDGSFYEAWCWDSAGDGAGVGFMIPYECTIDSIMVHMGYESLPVPGDTLITLAIYDRDTTFCRDDTNWGYPGYMIWQNANLHVQRGMWNRFPVTPPQPFSSDTNFGYAFYLQQGKYPNCPSFSSDNGCNFPAQSWTHWQLGGGFFNENPGGDWMLRVYATNLSGVGEWISPVQNRPMLRVPSITKGETEILFTIPKASMTDLRVYNAIGWRCRTIVSQRLPAGTHRITTNLTLPAGVYFYKLTTESGVNITKKFILVR